MLYRIDFEIAGFIIFIIVLLFYYTKRSYPSLSNRIYGIMLVNAASASGLCILSCFTVSYPEQVGMLVNQIVNLLYLCAQNLTPFLFYEYVIALTEYRQRVHKESKLRTVLSIIPCSMSILSVVSSPITGLAYYFDENDVYKQGDMMLVMYGIALFYLLVSLVYIIRYRNNIEIKKRCATYIFIIFTISAVVLQSFIGDLLLTGFASGCSALILFLMLQNPEESIDKETGLFNRNAFIFSVSEYVKTESSFRIINIAPDDIQEINVKHGYDIGSELLNSIAAFLNKLALDVNIYRLEGDNFAIVSRKRDVSTEHLISLIQDRFRKAWVIGEKDIYLTTCICCMTYPDNAKSIEEIIDVMKYSVMDAKRTGKGTVFYAREHITTREKRISELEIQKKKLEELSEEAYRAKSQAEQADKAKSIFLANMSHEIRTPMNAIIGMTDLILKDEINNRVRSNALDIKAAGASLVGIINDILDISKIESGKTEINEAPYQLNRLIRDVINIISARFVNSPVEFYVEINPKLPDNLIGDEMRIKQIMINLLSNAQKFTTNGFVLFTVDGEINRDNLQLKCSVKDTGTGIKEEDMPQLFNSFTRLNSRQNRKVEGTGLGLAISKKIVEMMKGHIRVESVLGEGSTFSFELPQKIDHLYSLAMTERVVNTYKPLIYGDCMGRAEILTNIFDSIGITSFSATAEKNLEDLFKGTVYTNVFMSGNDYLNNREVLHEYFDISCAVIQHLNDGPIHDNSIIPLRLPIHCINVVKALDNIIADVSEPDGSFGFTAPEASALIVDDNEVNLRVAQGLLESYDIKCTTAESGMEGVELLRDNYYDIIFLDHMMPVMDGIDTLKLIRKTRGLNYNDAPVIALTANAISGIKEKFIAEGFSGYLSKPINIKQLEDVLRKFLKQKIVEDSSVKRSENVKNIPRDFAIQGIDIGQGFKSCSHDPTKYLDLLNVVYESGKKKIKTISKCVLERDEKNYLIEVHALKSVCGTIGAGVLHDIAARHESEMKEGNTDFMYMHSDELLALYREMLDNIGNFLDGIKEEEIRATENINEDELKSRITEAIDYISEFEDQKAVEILKGVTAYKLETEQKEVIDEAINELRLFSFDEALKLLEKLNLSA